MKRRSFSPSSVFIHTATFGVLPVFNGRPAPSWMSPVLNNGFTASKNTSNTAVVLASVSLVYRLNTSSTSFTTFFVVSGGVRNCRPSWAGPCRALALSTSRAAKPSSVLASVLPDFAPRRTDSFTSSLLGRASSLMPRVSPSASTVFSASMPTSPRKAFNSFCDGVGDNVRRYSFHCISACPTRVFLRSAGHSWKFTFTPSTAGVFSVKKSFGAMSLSLSMVLAVRIVR